jgi:hypothetical protein
VLLNSCADWTAEEKHVVQKILKSMGVTVIERRNWLAKLRQSLMDASAKVARKTGRWFAAETGSAGGAEDGNGAGTGIPPSAFLHCLRDCGVVLTVEEEATLLDCLDTERLAKVRFCRRDQSLFCERGWFVSSSIWSHTLRNGPSLHLSAICCALSLLKLLTTRLYSAVGTSRSRTRQPARQGELEHPADRVRHLPAVLQPPLWQLDRRCARDRQRSEVGDEVDRQPGSRGA